MGDNIAPGLLGEARVVVMEEQTARHLGSGGVNVFATPAMVRLVAGEEDVEHVVRPLAEEALAYATSG